MTKLAYYPGCTLKTTAKNFDDSTVASAKALGIELVEPERWNCCGTVHALAKDDVMHHLAPVRNMLRVQEMNSEGQVDSKEMITLCAMCYNTLKRSNQTFNEDSDKKQKIQDIMFKEEATYSGSVEVKHFLETLKEMGWDKVKEAVKTPLTGLKVAPYYGCLLLRPRGIGIDDTDNPRIIEDLFEALGAEVVNFAYKQKCCGSYNTVHMKEVVGDLAHKILKQAKDGGADILATACPLCEYNLGPRQEQVKVQYPSFDSIPVVYFTQLMSLAFGLGDEAMAFEANRPDPRPLLREKGLLEE
ncbi:MAG: CoB--CoM heterodisulfide reductase iron-sulfur subunit B family protein [Candidatus Bathyarchaeota archaeon]|nr:CoB--CoM heterodisulfide reductase iron-sulfur subunit B family protein [Candidatus Bathyarchaeota archaeon]